MKEGILKCKGKNKQTITPMEVKDEKTVGKKSHIGSEFSANCPRGDLQRKIRKTPPPYL